ncbi:MAG: hypothetical protein IKM25_04135 [Clostridia bacterium]|nr:hypothetical protein [Clostridia bacterium]
MITFLPDHKQDCFCFRAFENGEELGFCTYRNEGYRMVFLSMECADDIAAEGLARAAMNSAANQNAYLAVISKELYRPAFARLGFENADGAFVEIPEALAGGCSCSHN